jgi:hypothetical protein
MCFPYGFEKKQICALTFCRAELEGRPFCKRPQSAVWSHTCTFCRTDNSPRNRRSQQNLWCDIYLNKSRRL